MNKRAIFAAALLLPLAAACSTSSPHSTPASAAPAATSSAPAAAPLDAKAVTDRLAQAIPGLRLVKAYTAADDPNHLLGRPGGYTSKTAFADPRVKAGDVAGTEADAIERGGSVEVFQSAEEATARQKYGQQIAKAMPALAEYDYVHGSILVRVSRYLTPDQAAAYQRVINSL